MKKAIGTPLSILAAAALEATSQTQAQAQAQAQVRPKKKANVRFTKPSNGTVHFPEVQYVMETPPMKATEPSALTLRRQRPNFNFKCHHRSGIDTYHTPERGHHDAPDFSPLPPSVVKPRVISAVEARAIARLDGGKSLGSHYADVILSPIDEIELDVDDIKLETKISQFKRWLVAEGEDALTSVCEDTGVTLVRAKLVAALLFLEGVF